MSKDRKFVNPLTRPSEQAEPTSTSMNTFTYTDTEGKRQPVRRKEQTFEQAHERMTAWVDRELKERFETLAQRERITKSALLNEAIADLIEKYHSR